MSAPTNIIQRDLEAWDGIGDPPGIATIQAHPEYQALPPADKVQALNQAQRMASNRLRTDDPKAYPDLIRDVETDFTAARSAVVESALADDLANGALTDAQVKAYATGGTAALANEGEAAGYVQQRYGDDADRAGPWVTHKLPVTGADGKPQGYAYIRHDPHLTGDALNADIAQSLDPRAPGPQFTGSNDRVEVSWVINGKEPGKRKPYGVGAGSNLEPDKPVQITGVEDVNVGNLLAGARRSADTIRLMTESGSNPEAGYFAPTIPKNLQDDAATLSLPSGAIPAVLGARAFSALAQKRPEIADKVGQGFWQGLPGEAAKGFLALGAAAVHGPAALTGDKSAVREWQQAQQEIANDIEGQSGLAFRGDFTDKMLQGISAEALPMAFSMGASAAAAVARRGFQAGVTNLIAAAGPGAVDEGLANSLTRGLFGKWLGSAPIEGKIAQGLADRVTNAVAFLPSSARTGLDNMAATLNKADELRAAGDEAGAQAMEDRALVNGWAGVGFETLSENMWLNEMLVTRAGRSLARVSTDVLERQLSAGKMAALAARGKEFLKHFVISANEEGVEEIAAGVGNRAWMNAFAAQNQDLFADIPQEYATGAAMGGLMGGAKALQHDGKPGVYREMVLRGIDGDAPALAALARIRAMAEAKNPSVRPSAPPTDAGRTDATTNPPGADAALSSSPPPAVVTGPAESGVAPGTVTRLANIAGNTPPPIEGDATEAPAGPMDPQLVDMPPPEGLDPSLVAPDLPPADESPAPEAPPNAQDAAPSNVDGQAEPPASGPESTLFPEDTSPVPAVETTSETVVPDANPPTAPVSPAADPGNVSAPTDSRRIGSSSVVTESPAALATEYAALQAELESKGVAKKVAILRAKGTTAFAGRVGKIVQRMREIEGLTASDQNPTVPASPPPAAQPAAVQGSGRRGKAGQPPAPAPGPKAQPARQRKPGPRFQKDAQTHPIISGLITAGVRPPPPHRFLAAKRKEAKDGLRITPADQEALNKSKGYDDMPTVGQYKGRPKAQDAIRQMYRTGSTRSVDQAFDEAMGQSDEALADRIRRLHQELLSLDGQTAPADINETDYSTEERQNGEFYAAVEKGMIRLETGSLKAGDVLDIEGERVTVARVNVGRDGTVDSVVLQDGRRFGKQIVNADVALFVEGYDPATAPPATDRNGSPLDPYRGDFLADTADEPFNLLAETPEERRAREARQLRAQKATEAKAAEERKRQAERDQIQMFPDESEDDMNPFSRAAGIDADHLTGVPPKAAADALGALRARAPELARNVRLIQNPALLNTADYSPAAWAAINDPQVEGFYNAATGETIILTDHITRRPGETAIGATARVILHERLAHAGLAILRGSDPAFAREWKALTDAIPVEELLALIPAYPHLRDDPARLAEEWFARQAEAAKTAPEGSLLRRLWDALKRALTKLWHGLKPGGMTLDDRVAEMLYQSRKALQKGATPGTGTDIRESRNPLEPRDWQSVPLPQWAKDKLGARAIAPYEVRTQAARAILTGSPLPREFAKIAAQTQEEIKAVQDRGAAIAADLQAAMKAYAKRSGTALQRVSDDINAALEDPAVMTAIADPVLKTRAIAARNFVDILSDEVANTTGGQLGKTIRQNAGHWLRRSYAAFDDSAGWDANTLREAARSGKQLAGRDARTILDNARAYLLTQYPGTPPLGIEVMISDLTNRDAWQSATFGIPRADGSRVSREVSSFMQRKDIAPEIRALMGEERNPIKRLSRSISIQAQLIARFDQQRAMRDLGLAMGVFSHTADATYHRPVGGTDVHGNMRWNGFAITDPTSGKSQPVYTTPEMEAALNAASAADGKNLGGVILRAYKALGSEAKLNRVALNPDSWAVNIFGNVLGLVQSGDMFHFAGWQRIAEAVRLHASSREMSGDTINAVAEAIREQQRAIVGRMAAAGVAGASFDMRDLEASIDQATLAFIQGTPLRNIAAGATRGAIAGQAFGKAGGRVGQVIGGAAGAVAGGIVGGRKISAAQKAIAQAVLSAPDNIGKIAVFLGNYAAGLSAGMADQAAFAQAAEKTRNTMPDYAKLPALLREGSKLGIMGSFIAFQWEVYRNYYHNIRYAFQELKSGNPAMMARGLRRMIGAATVTAAGSGLLAALAGAGGDDKDEAYRRALGAPWERYSKLAYTKLDKEEASFFNTSYLIPQTSLFEVFRAAREGKSFEDGLTSAIGAARRQFAGGSVSADPILEAVMNTKMAGGKVTYEDGAAGFFERLAHVMRVTSEPGAANKAERIGKAIRGEELRGRKFSLEEELVRALGIRQGTYRHEDRIRGKLYTIREAYADARTAANKAWRDTPMDRDHATARANERIAEIEQDYHDLQTDLRTLGVPKSKVEDIRKDVGLGVNFYRLKAGKDKPESIIK